MFNNLSSENRAVYEIMWNNMVQPDRPQVTAMQDARIQTHSQFLIFVDRHGNNFYAVAPHGTLYAGFLSYSLVTQPVTSQYTVFNTQTSQNHHSVHKSIVSTENINILRISARLFQVKSCIHSIATATK
jgi:hypothetical protein